MSQLDPLAPEIDSLIGKLLDGLIDAQETRQLETLLKADGAARDRYIDLVMLHSLLQWRGIGREIPLPVDLSDDGAGTGLDLNSTMILPAIQNDEVDAPRPSAGSSTATSSYDSGIPLIQERAATLVQGAASQGAGAESVRKRKFIRVWWLAASVLVAASLAALVAYTLMNHRSRAADVATLTGTIDARWDDAQRGLADGATLPLEQRLSLRSGWAEWTYPNGVVVTIEGPARFWIKSGQTLSLDAGKLVALVPKAGNGFAVQTPSARIVDLGTEFGVAVSSAGETDVDTFRGTVSLTPTRGGSASASTLLVAGFARHITPTGDIAEVTPNENAFVRPRQFDDWNSTHAAGYELWRIYSERLRHDPDLVAYYTFDNAAQTPDRLRNESSLGSSLDGVLSGDTPAARPTWTTGRWPQKGALEFSGSNGSRVVVPSGIGDPLDFSRGQQPASPLTIAAWIRPAARGSGIIVAKGSAYSEQFAMEMARGWVRQTPGNFREAVTKRPTSLPPEGVWSQIVFTYDPVQRSGRVYRNGLLIAQEENCPTRLLAIDAPMFIGCHPDGSPVKPGATVHYINGLHCLIDELLITKRAMSTDEVREMYRIGKPG
jgi:hypothetical protein